VAPDDLLKRREKGGGRIGAVPLDSGPCMHDKRKGDGCSDRAGGYYGERRCASHQDEIDNKKALCSDARGVLWRKPRLPSMVRWPVREIREP
jgi:hypothetical protein